jgi:murein DD-endopeptidase MepM/ murein hydrolase activator NlpD
MTGMEPSAVNQPIQASTTDLAVRRPQALRVDPFVQLLTMQMESVASPSDAAGIETGAWPATLAAANSGAEASPLRNLLTLTLLRVLERLIDSGTPTNGSGSAPDLASGGALPVAGRISQGFHDGHRAVDIAVPVGTPVQSTGAGRVVHAGWNTEGYGNLVIVENGPYRTYYAHLDSIGVAVGQNVAAGEAVGRSGNTGNSTGPHLHYEVRLNGQPIDPTAHVDHGA